MESTGKKYLRKFSLYYRECLRTLTPQAFRFYLPAYMLLVLLNPKLADTLINVIVSDLSPSSGKSWSNWHNRILKDDAQVFIPEEASAIIVFLEAYLSLYNSNDPYLGKPPFPVPWDTENRIKSGLQFWKQIRDGVDVSL